jgi:hypothetical protein
MFAKTNIIMLSGWIGSGKSTIAQEIIAQLKEKEVFVEYQPLARRVKFIATLMGWDGKKDDMGRQLLIDIGMAGRKHDPFTWVKLVDAAITNGTEVVVIDDWRFPNEYEYLRSLNRYDIAKIRMERDGLLPLNDVSETSLPSSKEALSSAYYDIIINNEPDLLDSAAMYAKEIIAYLYKNSKQWS